MAKKKLTVAKITLISCGDAVELTAQDTVTEPMAKYAIDDFKAEHYMQFKDSSDDSIEYFVPFHAVDHIITYHAEADVPDRPNPYGCEAESGGADWMTLKICGENDGILEGSTFTTAQEIWDYCEANKVGDECTKLTIDLCNGEETSNYMFKSQTGAGLCWASNQLGNRIILEVYENEVKIVNTED